MERIKVINDINNYSNNRKHQNADNDSKYQSNHRSKFHN